MYEAKARRDGGVQLYGTARPVGVPDPTLCGDLGRAIAGDPGFGEVSVHYQPIVRLADEQVVAVEALARWRHPTAGQISPELFVAAAEHAGIVGALDNLVLERACRDLAALTAAGGPADLSMHVNVSATRVSDQAFADSVIAAVRRHGLRPGALVIEITETARITDLTAAGQVLARIAAHGVRVALDDIGAGHIPLAALKLLPLDMVKLDRQLLSPAEDGNRTAAFRDALIAFAVTMGITVVAEGVPSREQAAALAAAGCLFGQGFLYARPTPLDDISWSPRGELPLAA
jgi:EAL domain-containing protein (putative c-di-GMP-specific phosphodiesterase class I)